jgi:peptide/nickel transport system substrate-binding protein
MLSDYHLMIFPAGATQFGIGTGGYKLISYEPGVRCFTKRNPNYWKEGRAHFDEVEPLGIVDAPARTNALRTGQIDVLNRCELRTAHLLKKVPGIQVVATTGLQFYSFPMLCDVPP